MAPNGFQDGAKPSAYQPVEKEVTTNGDVKTQEIEQVSKRQPLKYGNIIQISLLHVFAIVGFFYGFFRVKIMTIVFCVIYGQLGGFGVTAGAHRLWAHRTYKATLPVRIMLAFFFSMAGQNTLPEWVLDHRVHHKFSETDADPHNSNRGFFFAHVGWLFQKKHPEVIKQGKSVDMSDIYADPVVQIHTKLHKPLYVICVFVIPIAILYYWVGESLDVAIGVNFVRYVGSLNITWSVNSAAHMFGYHPFSTRIQPAENKLVAFLALGEGWHNYHHVFPWDYKAAEFGNWGFNITAKVIEILGKLGLAYDLKSPSPDLVERVAKRFGDGSPRFLKEHHHPRAVDEEGKEIEERGEPEFVVPCQLADRKDQ